MFVNIEMIKFSKFIHQNLKIKFFQEILKFEA